MKNVYIKKINGQYCENFNVRKWYQKIDVKRKIIYIGTLIVGPHLSCKIFLKRNQQKILPNRDIFNINRSSEHNIDNFKTQEEVIYKSAYEVGSICFIQ